jgi:hypothetical protein
MFNISTFIVNLMVSQNELVITKAVNYLAAGVVVFNSPVFRLVTQSSTQILRFNVKELVKFMEGRRTR